MNTSFRAVCEAAQADWDVPALAVGTLVDGRVADGRARLRACDPLPDRLGHEADGRGARPLAPRPRRAHRRVAGRRPRPASALAHERLRLRARRPRLRAVRPGRRRARALRRRAAVGAAVLRRRGGLVVRQHRLLARRRAVRAASGRELRGGARRARPAAGRARGDVVRRARPRRLRAGPAPDALSASAASLRRARLDGRGRAAVRRLAPRAAPSRPRSASSRASRSAASTASGSSASGSPASRSGATPGRTAASRRRSSRSRIAARSSPG